MFRKKTRKYGLILSLIYVLIFLLHLNSYAADRVLRVGLAAPNTVYSVVTLSFNGPHSVIGKYGMKPVLEYEEPAVYEAKKLAGYFEISASTYRHISEVNMAEYPSGLPLVTEQGLKIINPVEKGEAGTKSWTDSKIELVSFALINQGGRPKFALFDSLNLIVPRNDGFFQFYHYPYRGAIGFYFERINGIFPINTVGVENYLYGVVPKEMPSSWNMEALKAQAVCARTYALSSLGKYADWDYDLAPTTHSQVYGGYGAEEETTNKAVDATRGEELFYGENRVECFFHASNGGYMANSEDVFVTKLPYFNAKPDPYTESVNQEWELELNGAEISAYLKKEGVNIGDFLYIDNLEVNPSRRVDSLRVVGTEGSYKMDGRTFRYITDIDSLYFGLSPKPSESAAVTKDEIKELSILSAKDLSAQPVDKLFVLSQNGKASKLNGKMVQTASSLISLNSTDKNGKPPFHWSQVTKGTKIYGYGNGHGLGLSQWGADVMANQGKNYKEILSFYYDGAVIKTQ